MGCLLDVITALAGIGSAVAVFPVVRRQNEGLALGFVTSRMFEAAVIMIGVVSLLAVVTLRQEFAGAAGVDQSALQASGHALVAVRDWTFQFGPNLAAGINAILFGTLLYRSRLVPRAIPILGLIGAPLLLAVTLATALGFIPPAQRCSALPSLSHSGRSPSAPGCWSRASSQPRSPRSPDPDESDTGWSSAGSWATRVVVHQWTLLTRRIAPAASSAQNPATAYSTP
jgi:hypothetical protein